MSLGFVPIVSIPLGQKCQDECVSPPTAGQNGGNGLQGIPGSDGKKGGDSGSFYLTAFELSDFHLTSIQNNPGIGSKGSRGSLGGLARCEREKWKRYLRNSVITSSLLLQKEKKEKEVPVEETERTAKKEQSV